MVVVLGATNQFLFTASSSTTAQQAAPVTVFHWLMSRSGDSRLLRMFMWLQGGGGGQVGGKGSADGMKNEIVKS